MSNQLRPEDVEELMKRSEPVEAATSTAAEKSKPKHLICPGCGKQVPYYFLGPWCDKCGGISARPGVLLLRHVATVDGAGGRHPIVFDASTQDYSCSFERATPRSHVGKRDDDGFLLPHITTFHGTLDAVVALMQPVARGPKDAAGNPPELPALEAAPSATKDELAILAL